MCLCILRLTAPAKYPKWTTELRNENRLKKKYTEGEQPAILSGDLGSDSMKASDLSMLPEFSVRNFYQPVAFLSTHGTVTDKGLVQAGKLHFAVEQKLITRKPCKTVCPLLLRFDPVYCTPQASNLIDCKDLSPFVLLQEGL